VEIISCLQWRCESSCAWFNGASLRFNACFVTVFRTILLHGSGSFVGLTVTRLSFVGLTGFCCISCTRARVYLLWSSRSPQRTYSLSSCGSSHTRCCYVVFVARPLFVAVLVARPLAVLRYARPRVWSCRRVSSVFVYVTCSLCHNASVECDVLRLIVELPRCLCFRRNFIGLRRSFRGLGLLLGFYWLSTGIEPGASRFRCEHLTAVKWIHYALCYSSKRLVSYGTMSYVNYELEYQSSAKRLYASLCHSECISQRDLL